MFEDISFSLNQSETLLVTGRNGSGKSTLVKILIDVLTPSAGTVKLLSEQNEVIARRQHLVGHVSPYLQLYEEFSAAENLAMGLSIRGIRGNPASTIDSLLTRFGIVQRKNDPVRMYSSGMKQRVKYAFALIHNPPILILDEPTSNLDEEGSRCVRAVMREHRETGILIVATNDLSDVEHYDQRIDLDTRI